MSSPGDVIQPPRFLRSRDAPRRIRPGLPGPRELLLALAAFASACGPPSPALLPVATTAAFLGSDDFLGKFTRRKQDATIGGQATYDGRIVFTNLPDTVVDDALPPDLALASNPTSQPSLHPVLLIFGHQRHTKWVLPLYNPPIGDDYTELIAIIPFVVKAGGGTLWHNYVVRIYLDNDIARYIGNLYFGLRKRKATFVESSTTLDVYREGVHWFQASASGQGSWMSNVAAEQSLPNWPAVEAILSMPVLGTLVGVPGQPHVCTYFEWHYHQAQVRAFVSQHAFLQPFTAGVTSWPAQGALQSVADGAFEIQGLRWRMAFPPIPCRL